MFGRKIHSHGGGINGFAAQIIRFPDDKATVVVLCNLESAPAMKIGRDLAAILFGEKYELPIRRTEIQLLPEKLKPLVGSYELSPEIVVTITVEDGQLMMQATNHPKYPLFAESESRFFLKVADAQIEFVSDEDGKVTHIVMHDEGKEGRAKRLE
jgi:hypothetical protein